MFEQEYKAFIRSDIILGKIEDAKEHVHLEEEQAVARLIRFRLAEKDRPFGISHVRGALTEGRLVIMPDAHGIIFESRFLNPPDGGEPVLDL